MIGATGHMLIPFTQITYSVRWNIYLSPSHGCNSSKLFISPPLIFVSEPSRPRGAGRTIFFLVEDLECIIEKKGTCVAGLLVHIRRGGVWNVISESVLCNLETKNIYRFHPWASCCAIYHLHARWDLFHNKSLGARGPHFLAFLQSLQGIP